MSFSCSQVVPLSLLRSTRFVSWTTSAREPEDQAQLSIHTSCAMMMHSNTPIDRKVDGLTDKLIG